MHVLRSVRTGGLRLRTMAGPGGRPVLNWIGDERIAVSGVPSALVLADLSEQSVTHVVNCRPRLDVWWTGDLAAERAAFGAERVAHAPMQDHGLRLRGHDRQRAAELVLRYRPEAELLPAYARSVERWLASGGTPRPADV